MRRFVQRSLWIIIPCVILLSVEGFARYWFDDRVEWYTLAEQLASRFPLDYLFIGQSRVGAAVHPTAFERAVAPHSDQEPILVVNLGMGQATLTQHYFGLRNLLEQHPDCLRGSYVFIGLLSGLPYESPESPWLYENTAWSKMLLLRLLRRKDLPILWRSNDLDSGTKLELTLRYAAQGSIALRHREVFRFGLLNRTQATLHAFAENRFPHLYSSEPPDSTDLRQIGGIRTDQEGIALNKAHALQQQETKQQHQHAWRDWDASILPNMIRLIEHHGGQVVFFEVPVHSSTQQPRQTALRKQDKVAFKQHAQRWGTPIIEPNFAYDDTDFPDYTHLRASRVLEYTDSLAQAFLRHVTAASD